MANLLFLDQILANKPLLIDIVVCLIILVFVIMDASKGFSRRVIKVFGTFLSIILGVLFCSQMASFLQDKFGLVATLTETVSGGVTGLLGDLANTTLAEATEGSLESGNVMGFLIKIILEAKNNPEIPMNTTLNQVVAPTIAYYVACAISFIGLFILFKILFFLLGVILKQLQKIKVIGVTDKLLGAVLGVVEGIISVQTLIMILGFLQFGILAEFYASIDTTVICKVVNSINLFEVLGRSLSFGNVLNVIKGII